MDLRLEIVRRNGKHEQELVGSTATASDSMLVVRGTAALGSRTSAAEEGAGLPVVEEKTSRRLK